MPAPDLTPRQHKWFASLHAGLERETGKSLAEWVAIARTCPKTTPRARQRWLKAEHGLLQNRAMWVLDQAFGGGDGAERPADRIAALWSDPAAHAIMAAVDAAAAANPGTIRTARQAFTAWSRTFQYAALRPLKAGGAVLGLALPPTWAAILSPPKRQPWSERLKSCMPLATAADITAEVAALLTAAWETS